MSANRPGPPDPREADTAAEFVRSLVRLKRWAGEPPLSRLRSLGGHTVTPDGTTIDTLPKSTTSHVLRQTDKLPRWDFVKAFVTACLRYCDYPADQIPGELERWRAARTALAGPAVPEPSPSDAVELPVEVPVEVPVEAPVEAPVADWTAQEATGRLLDPDQAVELLARRVAREEDRARKGLLGGYSVAPVSFGTHTDPLRSHGSTREVAGDLHSIGRFFSGLRPQRLLIVGEPGAGKTVLAIELVLQLVEPLVDPGRWPTGRSVVPVRLNAARWASEIPFETWLAAQLVQDFGLPAGDATRLVRDRRVLPVLPVLDGLDELDPEPSMEAPRRAIGLLAELNRYSHPSGRRPGAVVVTCRADRYTELSQARAGLGDAVRIRLHDLNSEQISAYLHTRWPDGHPCAADRDGVRAALSGASGSAVHAALATPWRLLLTATAVESGADPAELLKSDPDADQRTAAAQIAERLLDAYVPAATRLTPRGHGGPYHPGQVRTWLVHLAAHLRWQAGYAGAVKRPPPGLTAIDLVPHLLWPIGGRRRIRLLHCLCCMVFAVIAMAAFWAGSAVDRFEDLRAGIDLGEGLTLTLMAGWVGIATGLSLSPWPAAAGGRANVPFRRRLTSGLLGALVGGPLGVLGGLAGLVLTGGRVFGPAFAIAAGLTGGTLLGVLIAVTAAGRRGGGRMPISEAIRAEPVILLGFGLCGALTGLPPLRLAHAGPVALLAGVTACFVLAVALGAAFRWATGGWSTDAELTHPREALRRNPAVGVAFGLTGGVAAALVFVMNQGVIMSLACAVIGGVAFGLSFGAIAWARSTIGLFVAAARGLLPLRLWTFLDWACEARLLRISGATYQFRHRELQDFLTPLSEESGPSA